MAESLAQTNLLLRRWHDGDRSALDTLLARDYEWVRDRVREKLGAGYVSRKDADDLVSETMIRIIEQSPPFAVRDRSQFRELLARMVENDIRHAQENPSQTHRARPLTGDTSLYEDPPRASVPAPADQLFSQEKRTWIQFAVDLLPPEQARLVRMRHFEELSFPEIGTVLGINAECARQRLLRVMPKLARNLSLLTEGRLDELLLTDS